MAQGRLNPGNGRLFTEAPDWRSKISVQWFTDVEGFFMASGAARATAAIVVPTGECMKCHTSAGEADNFLPVSRLAACDKEKESTLGFLQPASMLETDPRFRPVDATTAAPPDPSTAAQERLVKAQFALEYRVTGVISPEAQYRAFTEFAASLHAREISMFAESAAREERKAMEADARALYNAHGDFNDDEAVIYEVAARYDSRSWAHLGKIFMELYGTKSRWSDAMVVKSGDCAYGSMNEYLQSFLSVKEKAQVRSSTGSALLARAPR